MGGIVSGVLRAVIVLHDGSKAGTIPFRPTHTCVPVSLFTGIILGYDTQRPSLILHLRDTWSF